MWRWYVEVAFLVMLCFGLGAAVAALVLTRLLPKATPSPDSSAAAAPATPAGSATSAEAPGAGGSTS